MASYGETGHERGSRGVGGGGWVPLSFFQQLSITEKPECRGTTMKDKKIEVVCNQVLEGSGWTVA